jgi:hypothetical protein
VVEGARLESVCTLTAYRGFESHSLRFFPCPGPTLTPFAQPRQDRNVAAVSEWGLCRDRSGQGFSFSSTYYFLLGNKMRPHVHKHTAVHFTASSSY